MRKPWCSNWSTELVTEMPRRLSSSIQSEVTCLWAPRALTAPARWIAPPCRSSFSVNVVLPASGCEMMANVRLRRISVLSFCWSTSVKPWGSGPCGPPPGAAGLLPWTPGLQRTPGFTEVDQQKLKTEILRRRTFAIISHPDAGKTTLTEKLPPARRGDPSRGSGQGARGPKARHLRLDGAGEAARISVTSSVLQFEHQGFRINLLDTPGHQDFSEDTYRTLAAADAR